MSLSQTKKAINERRRRANEREKRRHNTFIHDYMRTKHKEIYRECDTFYQALRNQYPAKLNLVKTYAYKKWKDQVSKGETEMSEPATETGQIQDETQMSESVSESTTSESVSEPTTSEPETETTNETETEPTTSELEAVQLGVETDKGSSILEDAMEGLFPGIAEDVTKLGIDDMDRIVRSIITELEQERGVLDLLPEESEEVEFDNNELGTIVEFF